MSFLQMFMDKVVLQVIVGVVIVLVSLFVTRRLLRKTWHRVAAIALLCALAASAVYYLAHTHPVDRAVAGSVLDESTREPVPGALVSVIGRQETSTTESNGNFRIEFDLTRPLPEVVRLRTVANGYASIEEDIRPPSHSVVVQLPRAPK